MNNDEIFLICTRLDINDLLNFVMCNKRIYELIMKKSDIFLYKLKREFPKYVSNESHLKTYRRLHKISRDLKNFDIDVYTVYDLYFVKELGENDALKLLNNLKILIDIIDYLNTDEKKSNMRIYVSIGFPKIYGF